MRLLSFIVILSLAAVVPAQQRKQRAVNHEGRIIKVKPTVYIDFVRFGKRDSGRVNESDEGVWLRVHNNTRWSLVFAGLDWFLGENRDYDYNVFYGVEEISKAIYPIRTDSLLVIQTPLLPSLGQPPTQTQAPEPPKVDVDKDCAVPPGYWGSDVVAPITLPPGKSMKFSVPREALCKELKIYLNYNYSWEKHDEYRPFDFEPEHRVYFEGADLPKAAR